MRALTIAFAGLVGAASLATAGPDALREHVTYLASDELGGRLTGTEGERMAAAYIASELEAIGAEPLPGASGFQVPFEFTAGSRDGGTTLTLRGDDGREHTFATDEVMALSFSDAATVSGPVVFAGYGLVIPDGQEYPYDSYATLDVEDKIVVALRYFPEDVDQETRGILSRYSGLRYKAMQARERGAKALVVITGPHSPNAGGLVPMNFDTAISGSGLAAASVGSAAAERLFEYVDGKTLAEAQRAFDDGNPHVIGYEIPGVEITLDVRIERERRTGHNVVGVVPATHADGVDRPWIALGAHYDHLGHGDGGNSLAKKHEAGDVHHGADDNASGVAAVLEAGRRIAEMPERRRHVVLAFWSGEEMGLLGSSRFVADEALPAAEMAAYVNLDMVGRVRDNRLTVQALGSSPAWPRVVERANLPVGFDLATADDPYLPTDSSSFNKVSVPTLHLFSGSHKDYHRPSDTADKLNYDDLARVAQFTTRVTAQLMRMDAAPEFAKVEPKVSRGGAGRGGARVFTGTIPDYTAEVEGLLLAGVIGGGPADEAGLREGDVVVEFAGQTITNIYDYTYALESVKVDEPVAVVALRDGDRVEMTLTPRARK